MISPSRGASACHTCCTYPAAAVPGTVVYEYDLPATGTHLASTSYRCRAGTISPPFLSDSSLLSLVVPGTRTMAVWQQGRHLCNAEPYPGFFWYGVDLGKQRRSVHHITFTFLCSRVRESAITTVRVLHSGKKVLTYVRDEYVHSTSHSTRARSTHSV